MNSYLLDTSIALLAMGEPGRVAPRIRRSLDAGSVYLSVVSWWEVILKSSKGKLDVGDPRAWWVETLDRLGAIVLPLRPEHVSELPNLPPVHSDPFDRIPLAQAMAENLAFVTTYRAIASYGSSRLRIVS